ncbi:MAG: cyclase family protein [Chlorobi bacterium]|nr:cyclase family protein [Chlorobiota bacterium]
MAASGMEIIDLSRTVGRGMSCYPGTPQPESRSICTIEEDGFNERMISFSSHTGTHVDLPLHMLQGGRSLDDFGIDRFVGRAAVIDVQDAAEGTITLQQMASFRVLIETLDFVLLHSGWSRYWGTDAYLSGYPVLTPEAAEWLAGFRLKGIGADMVSFEAAGAKSFPVHKALFAGNLVLVENLCRIDRLIGREFMFFSVPLKLEGAEAAPVRAIAVTG